MSDHTLKSFGLPWTIGDREPQVPNHSDMEDLMGLVNCGLDREEILLKLDHDLSDGKLSSNRYSRLLGAYIQWSIDLTSLDE